MNIHSILFVDACMRGPEASRTWQLSQAFLSACQARWPEAEIRRRDLTDGALPPLTAALAEERDRRVLNQPQDPMFDPAWEMQKADMVVIAAPYWDLSFPSALKIYLEWASVLGITFHYTREGMQEGLCRADRLVYITTAGGMLEGQNFGFDYVRGLGRMFGIPQAHCLAAQGLDIQGNDPEALLARAREEALQLAGQL